MSFGQMPWHNRLELACTPSAVQWARLHARDILKQWSVLETVIDDALLVVSELATNAVRHTGLPGDPPPWGTRPRVARFALTLWCYPSHLQIYVYDQVRTPPVLRQPTTDGLGGRGLVLVENLCSKWGYTYPTPRPDSGKTVWAQIDFPGNPAPTDLTDEQVEIPPPRQGDVPTWHSNPATMQQGVTTLRGGLARA